jgi:hypothetical protein
LAEFNSAEECFHAIKNKIVLLYEENLQEHSNLNAYSVGLQYLQLINFNDSQPQFLPSLKYHLEKYFYNQDILQNLLINLQLITMRKKLNVDLISYWDVS